MANAGSGLHFSRVDGGLHFKGNIKSRADRMAILEGGWRPERT